MKYSTLCFAVVLAVSMSAQASAQRRSSRNARSDDRSRLDTTLVLDRNGTVSITASGGDIVVTAASGNQVHVHAVSDDEDGHIDFSATHSMIEISGTRRGADTQFEISVPAGTRVIAHAQSGDVSVRGTHGDVEVHVQSGDAVVEDVAGHLDVQTLSGDITASQVNGDAQIATLSGDIKLTDVRGSVDITSTSGDITIRGATSRSVRALTTSGDVTYDGTVEPNGRYDLTSHSGGIHLHVPRDASAQLTVSTWSGEIDSDFPITLKPGEHGIGSSKAKEVTFQIGGGSARISAKTFSGDVTVSSNGRGGARP
jgi:DUF4097 and DUF4098 domain-containing protein YvlB